MRPIALQMPTIGPVWWNVTNTQGVKFLQMFARVVAKEAVIIRFAKKISEGKRNEKADSKSQEPWCCVLKFQGPPFTLFSGFLSGKTALVMLKKLTIIFCEEQNKKAGRSRQNKLARGFIWPRRWIYRVHVFVDREQGRICSRSEDQGIE